MKIYQVGFRFVTTTLPAPLIPAIETSMSGCGDWIRLNVYIWYVATNKSSAEVFAALRGYIKGEDSMVVMAMDQTDFNGWAPPWIWEWFLKRQPGLGGLLGPR